MTTSVTLPPTFERFALPGEIELGVNSNPKLKTILVKLYISADLDESVTWRALLPMVLRRGTSRLRDMQAIHRHLEGLYGAGITSGVGKVGEWHITRFRLEVVNDAFLPARENLFRQGLEFLRELIFDPLTVGGGFRADYVEREKETLRAHIESLLDDKGAYASFRCIEEMCRDEPYRLGENGRVEDLGGIDPQGLLANHREVCDRVPLAIYVAGDIDVAAARETVEGVFRVPRTGGGVLKPMPAPVAVGETREVEEKLEVQQAKLVLGFRHGVTYVDDLYEALLVMNGILGGFSHSKLFQNVREKASLAYSASSWLERTKGLLFVACGIAPENRERALDIILEQVEAMRRGEITDDEIESTIRTMHNRNLMLEDNFSALADIDHVWSLHGRKLDLAAFRERLRGVKREEIVAVARKLEHDTTYFLHG